MSDGIVALIASGEQTRSIHACFEAVQLQLQQLIEEEQERLRGRLNEARALVGELALHAINAMPAAHTKRASVGEFTLVFAN